MGKGISKPVGAHEPAPVSLSELIHQHVRVAIETALHEELRAARDESLRAQRSSTWLPQMASGTSYLVVEIRGVRHEATGFDELAFTPDRGYPGLRGKVHEDVPVRSRQKTGSPEQRLGVLSGHRGKSALEFTGLPDFQSLQCETECWRRVLEFFRGEHIGAVARIVEHRNPGGLRDHCLQELQPLTAELGTVARQAGDVRRRSREVRDESGADRIRHTGEDDRDRSRRLLGRHSCRRAGGDDHAWSQSDQLRCELEQALWPSTRESVLDGDVLTLDVTKLAQPLPEGVDFRR
jgi:hypothetical protein